MINNDPFHIAPTAAASFFGLFLAKKDIANGGKMLNKYAKTFASGLLQKKLLTAICHLQSLVIFVAEKKLNYDV